MKWLEGKSELKEKKIESLENMKVNRMKQQQQNRSLWSTYSFDHIHVYILVSSLMQEMQTTISSSHSMLRSLRHRQSHTIIVDWNNMEMEIFYSIEIFPYSMNERIGCDGWGKRVVFMNCSRVRIKMYISTSIPCTLSNTAWWNIFISCSVHNKFSLTTSKFKKSCVASYHGWLAP